MMLRFALAWTLVCAATASAYAQTTPDGGVSEEEIRKALQADVAAQKKQQPPTPAPVPPPPAAVAIPPATGGGWGSALTRVFQTLNPDISAIVDFAAGWFQDDDGTIKSGDDPQSTGFKAQEIELALQAVVDPYFRADIFLTIPNLEGIEVEE